MLACTPVGNTISYLTPSKAGIRTEESHVNDQTEKVTCLSSFEVRTQWDVVACTNQDQSDKESRKHHDGPETATACLHEENCWYCSEKEGAATDQGHVVGLCWIESDLIHENTHVIHDRIDTCELAEENHYVSIYNTPTASGYGEEVNPRESLVGRAGSNFLFFLLDRSFHDEEF